VGGWVGGWTGGRGTYVEAVRVRLVMMGLGSCSEALGLWLLWWNTGGLAVSSFSGVLGSAMAFFFLFTFCVLRSSLSVLPLSPLPSPFSSVSRSGLRVYIYMLGYVCG